MSKEYAAASAQREQASNAIAGAYEIQQYADTDDVRRQLADAQQRLQQAKAKQAEIEAQMKRPQQTIIAPTEIPGLKVHVCTLVAPDSPPGNWDYVYVHAKLMLIDDAFTTLGSANVNTRSMEVDSELNICHENGSVTTALRKRLWGIHTRMNAGAQTADNAKASGDDVAEAFKAWGKIIVQNTKNEGNKLAPIASLVGFMRASPKRSYLD